MAWKQHLHNCEDSLKFSPSISLDVFRQYFFGPLEFFCHPCVSVMCFVVFRSWPPLCWHALACLSRLASRCLATCWSQRFKGERAKSCASWLLNRLLCELHNWSARFGLHWFTNTTLRRCFMKGTVKLQTILSLSGHRQKGSPKPPCIATANSCFQEDIQSWNLPIQDKLFLIVYYTVLQCLQQILSLGVILPEKFVTHTDTVSPPVGKKPRCWQSAVTFTLRGRHVATLNKHERTEYIPKYPNTMQNVSLRVCCSLSHGKKRQGKHRLVRFGEKFSLYNYSKTVEYTWPWHMWLQSFRIWHPFSRP